MAPRPGGIKQKKCIIYYWASRSFPLFYSPKPRSQVWIFIHRNWSIWLKLLECISSLLSYSNWSIPQRFTRKKEVHKKTTNWRILVFVLKWRHRSCNWPIGPHSVYYRYIQRIDEGNNTLYYFCRCFYLIVVCHSIFVL